MGPFVIAPGACAQPEHPLKDWEQQQQQVQHLRKMKQHQPNLLQCSAPEPADVMHATIGRTMMTQQEHCVVCVCPAQLHL